MARYRIAHDVDRTWLCWDDQTQKYFWGLYASASLFLNYKDARAALDTMSVEKRIYGFPYEPKFMKFYDNDDHYKRENEYLANKRLQSSW